MSLPDYTHFMLPVLRAVHLIGGTATRQELYGLFGKNDSPDMQFTESELREVLPSGGSKLKHRVGWGLDRLLRCGFVERIERATYSITETGKQMLSKFPGELPEEVRREWSKTNTSLRLSGEPPTERARSESDSHSNDAKSPEDSLEEVLKDFRIELSSELRSAVSEVDDIAFERLVLHVLHGLGYGDGETPVEPTQRSSDGGIDGIISLDRLGVQKVYVQAKRWSGTVGRPQLQQFVGALGPHKSGVFITTSTYSRDAIEYAKQYDGRLVLIDGEQFVKLMIDAGVGVQVQKRIDLYKVDRDFFEDF